VAPELKVVVISVMMVLGRASSVLFPPGNGDLYNIPTTFPLSAVEILP